MICAPKSYSISEELTKKILQRKQWLFPQAFFRWTWSRPDTSCAGWIRTEKLIPVRLAVRAACSVETVVLQEAHISLL